MILRGSIIALIALAIDQAQKYYMIAHYGIIEKKRVYVTEFFNFVMVWNKGISFGLFQNYTKSNYFFLAASSSIILLLTYMLNKSRSRFEAASLGLIIGGALGNIIDRIQYGAVADFFDFHIGDYHWPAFNIADSCIFCGAVLLIVYSIFLEKNEKTK